MNLYGTNFTLSISVNRTVINNYKSLYYIFFGIFMKINYLMFTNLDAKMNTLNLEMAPLNFHH